MTRRRLILPVCVLAAVVLAGGAPVWWVMRPGTLERQFAQVRVGMTRTEIKAILGPRHDGVGGLSQWSSPEATVTIHFDGIGISEQAEIVRHGFFDRIRAWLDRLVTDLVY